MRIGVVGAGVMGRNHARVIAAQGHTLAGVADLDLKAAQAAAAPHGAPALRDVEDLLAHDLEALVVATPTQVHEAVARRALEAGVHVLVEKPLAATLPGALAIIEAARAARCVLAVGHVERHNPVVGYVRRALHDNKFGRPITLATKRVSRYPGRVRDVGVVLDIGIHDIDVLNHLVGHPPTTVYAVGGHYQGDHGHEDHAYLLLSYPGGVQGAVEVNWLTPRKVRRLSLTCDAAYVECDYMDQSVEISRTTYGRVDEGDLSQIPIETHSETVMLQREEPLARELADFVRAIQTGGAPLADGEAGMDAIRVALAALRSMKSGAPERLEQMVEA